MGMGLPGWKHPEMPTILRTGPYRFFFYASDKDEPIHVHIQNGNCLAKLWIRPVRVAANTGYSPKELRRVVRVAYKYQSIIEQKWYAFFGDSR